jgi:hypothetical protein
MFGFSRSIAAVLAGLATAALVTWLLAALA